MPASIVIRNALLVFAAWIIPAATEVLAATAMPDKARPTQAKPLLIGNWADPTVLKDGDDYYMTHSSFEYQPGLLIWHSKDLRTWRPIGHAVVNQEGSIWAPDLIKHEGRYYLYYPAAGTNWVVTADSPRGPWSQPKSIGVGMIDPGHVVGDNGNHSGHAKPRTTSGIRRSPC